MEGLPVFVEVRVGSPSEGGRYRAEDEQEGHRQCYEAAFFHPQLQLSLSSSGMQINQCEVILLFKKVTYRFVIRERGKSLFTEIYTQKS